MPRKHPAQINFRCKESEWEAYGALSESMDKPLSRIIREALNKLVKRHLGDDFLEEDDE